MILIFTSSCPPYIQISEETKLHFEIILSAFRLQYQFHRWLFSTNQPIRDRLSMNQGALTRSCSGTLLNWPIEGVLYTPCRDMNLSHDVFHEWNGCMLDIC